MSNYTVVVYPKNEDWQVINVEAESKLQATVIAVNEVMGYDVYDEENIKFKTLEELYEDVGRLGIERIDEALYRG